MNRTIHTLFFSPTHSSREIARTLADGLAVSLGGEQKIRDLTFPPEREESLDCAPGDVLVFAFPVYAGRVPQLLEAPLARVRGNGATAVVAAVYGNRDYDDALLEAVDLLTRRALRWRRPEPLSPSIPWPPAWARAVPTPKTSACWRISPGAPPPKSRLAIPRPCPSRATGLTRSAVRQRISDPKPRMPVPNA